MPPKNPKLDHGQITITEMLARKSNMNTAFVVKPAVGGVHESNQHFLIEVTFDRDENKCGINWTIMCNLDLHLISDTSECHVDSESVAVRTSTPTMQNELECHNEEDNEADNEDDIISRTGK